MVLFTGGDEHRRAARRRRRPGRSTARPTRWCTSTSSSWSSCRASSAPPATWRPQYIVAHEFGHHVQNLTGQNAIVQQASGETQRLMGIALELQADCYAGVWVHDAMRRRDRGGEDADRRQTSCPKRSMRPRAVGDDRIQLQTQGRVDPESFTHGTSAQREGWFRRGYETGDPKQCNTFAEIGAGDVTASAELAVQPLGRADAEPAVPQRAGGDRHDPVAGGEHEGEVEAGGSIQPSQLTTKLNTRAWIR